MSFTRKKSSKSFLLWACLFCCAFSAHTQKYVNEFLNIGVGARAHGMSGSMVANVEDGTAGYWNPSGLAGSKVPFQINAMHAQWFGGIANYDFLSIAKKFNDAKGSAGSISMVRLGIDNIPNTLDLVGEDGSVDYTRVSFFSDAAYAFLISYGQFIGTSQKLSAGGNFKIIHRSTGSFAKSWGFGADVGLKLRQNKWLFGAFLRDVTTTYNTWTFSFTEDEKNKLLLTGNDVPIQSSEVTLPRLIAGAAYKSNWKKLGYLVESNLVFSTDGRESALISSKKFVIEPSIGVELDYVDKVYLRLGAGNFQKVKSITQPENTSIEVLPTVGLGLKLGRLRVDYALSNIGSLSGVLVSHIFSARLDFYPKTAASTNL